MARKKLDERAGTVGALVDWLSRQPRNAVVVLRIVHDDGSLEAVMPDATTEIHDPGECHSCGHHPDPQTRIVLKGSC